MKNLERVYNLNFGEIYNLYLQKVTKKDRSEDELLNVLSWLTGYSESEIHQSSADEVSLKEFCEAAPKIAEQVPSISGVICGYRVEDIEDPIMRQIRAMDKVVDELAKSKKLEKIRREA